MGRMLATLICSVRMLGDTKPVAEPWFMSQVSNAAASSLSCKTLEPQLIFHCLQEKVCRLNDKQNMNLCQPRIKQAS